MGADDVPRPFVAAPVMDEAARVEVVDLDSWPSGTPSTPAEGHALTIGVATRPLSEAASRRATTLTCTLVPLGQDSHPGLVGSPDPPTAAEQLAARVERWPHAARLLDATLRANTQTDVESGIRTEASAYSALLAGPEFRDWLTDRSPRITADGDVRLVRDDDHLRITLDRPTKHNALSAHLRSALVRALELPLLDDSISSVTLDGAGATFSSGGDLNEFGTFPDVMTAWLSRVSDHPGRLIDRLGGRLSVTVHGPCHGAGVEMAAFASHVTARPGTTFRLPELEMGLIPGAGGTVSVPRRIGRWRTAWMVLSGATLDLDTAARWGLVDDVG